MESLVKLTVKTPNQGIEDIQVNCQLDWTVRKLKEYLQDVYPSKPASNSQRLIYLGRLLQDHLSLKEVFGEWGARVVHIVCNEANESMATRTASTTMATPSTNSSSTTNTTGTDGLRYRGYTTPQVIPSNQPFMGMNPMTTNSMSASMFPQYPTTTTTHAQPPNTSNHYYQIQTQLAQQYQQQMQLYYQQWYQWQQTVAAGGQFSPNQFVPTVLATPPNTPHNSSPVTSPPHPFSEPLQQPPQPQVAAAQPQPDAAQPQQPNNQPNNQNIRMNAGPGAVGMQADDDDDQENPRNQDWLDWLYTSLRAFMLLSIVYFYSSTSRFVMVTILAFLLYLYQNGWFTPRRVPIPDHVEDVHDNDEGERNNADGELNGEQVHPNTDPNDNSTNENQQPVRPSPLRMLCTFLVSFVTSLVPNPPAIPQQ